MSKRSSILLFTVFVGVSLGQQVRPYTVSKPAAPAQPNSTSSPPVANAPVFGGRLPYQTAEERWLGLDKLLPAALERIQRCDLTKSLSEIESVAKTADSAFSQKVGYWQSQYELISAEVNQWTEYRADIPRRQAEVDAIAKTIQSEISDTPERRAHLEALLRSSGAMDEGALASLDRVLDLAKTQSAVIQTHRKELDERMKSLSLGLEFLKQLAPMLKKNSDLAATERELWKTHYAGLGDVRRHMYAMCAYETVPPVCIHLPNSDGCFTPQKDK